MGKFASGKYALGISDRSGAAYKLRDMRKEWTGMLVGFDEWEPKQPQLRPRKVSADPQALRNPRPDREAPLVTVLLQNDPFDGKPWDFTIKEKRDRAFEKVKREKLSPMHAIFSAVQF